MADATGRPRLPRPPVLCYERAQPGERLPLDTKTQGRCGPVGQRNPRADGQPGPVAVDDRSRLAYAEVRPSARQAAALAFLDRALSWCRPQGIAVQAVMTENGSAYRSHVRCRARPAPPGRASLHAAPEREGGALHPAPAAELGVRVRVPHPRPRHLRPRRLASVV